MKVLRNCNHLLSGPAQSSLALAAWCLGEVYRSTPCEPRKFENGGFACLRQAIFHPKYQLLCLGEASKGNHDQSHGQGTAESVRILGQKEEGQE